MSNFQDFTNEAWFRAELHNIIGEIKDKDLLLKISMEEVMAFEYDLVQLRERLSRIRTELAKIEGGK